MWIFRRRRGGDAGRTGARHGSQGRVPGRGRSGPRDAADAVPDTSFPFLTTGQAARLRAMARQAFAEHGIEVEIGPDHLIAAGGGRYGLHNLFATCHNAPGGERAWRDLVQAHVARIGRIGAEPSPADLPDQDLLDRAVVRVCGTSTLPGSLDGFRYHRHLGGDLIELLVCDGPEAVAYLTDPEVERVGADRLRAAGVENLLREDFGRLHRLEGPRGSRFDVLLGDSVFTASRLLTMDDVLRRVTGDPTAPHGVLVGVPNRHQLAFHRLADATGIGALEGMARFTAQGFADGVGAVSPHVFWRPAGGGELQQVTRIEAPGEIVIRLEGEFEATLGGLLG